MPSRAGLEPNPPSPPHKNRREPDGFLGVLNVPFFLASLLHLSARENLPWETSSPRLPDLQGVFFLQPEPSKRVIKMIHFLGPRGWTEKAATDSPMAVSTWATWLRNEADAADSSWFPSLM